MTSGRPAPSSGTVSERQIWSGSAGASPTRAGSAPARWMSAAEPRSHWPRHGLRCQVTPAPSKADSVPSAPNRRFIRSHSSSAPLTWQARSSQMCTTAPGDGAVRNSA